MTEILLNQPSNDLLIKEENQLDWNKVLERLKKTFDKCERARDRMLITKGKKNYTIYNLECSINIANN